MDPSLRRVPPIKRVTGNSQDRAAWAKSIYRAQPSHLWYTKENCRIAEGKIMRDGLSGLDINEREAART